MQGSVMQGAWWGLVLGGLAMGGPAPEETPPLGLVRSEAGAFAGYTLFQPMGTKAVCLVDMDGQVVHAWEEEFAGGALYLRDDGNILFGTSQPDAPVFSGGGAGGRIQEYTWDGELVWDFIYATEQHRQHHDIEPLPNGNVLMIAWEYRSAEEAIGAGRDPRLVDQDRGFWPETIVEIKPVLPDGGEVVWKWRLWDHLIQDVDPALPDHGSVFDHPERVDINGETARPLSDEERERLEALGYIAAGDSRGADQRKVSDWCHMNAISYHPGLDQIVVSVPRFHEIWILDHSTTTEEAAGSDGGRWGKGGDLLYRYGNPQTYRRGTVEDQRLWFQHDVKWIPDGLPRAGDLTVFNNGRGRPAAEGGEHSSVDELALPRDASGHYVIEEGLPFGPDRPVWSFSRPEGPERMYSNFISGAQRLPNGNTLACSGADGRLLEVTPDDRIVWEYRNPFRRPAEQRDQRSRQGGSYRATRVPLDHPALQGRDLTPLDPQPTWGQASDED